jgi:hypothetical protein
MDLQVQGQSTFLGTLHNLGTMPARGSGSFLLTYNTNALPLSAPGCTSDAATHILSCPTVTLAPGATRTYTVTADFAQTPCVANAETYIIGWLNTLAADIHVSNNSAMYSGTLPCGSSSSWWNFLLNLWH